MNKSLRNSSSDWRVIRMSQIRNLIMQADANIAEERKYKMPSNPKGIPVWYKNGMICTGETYKKHLRLTFAKGPRLKQNDPAGLFNRHSAIVITEEDQINESAFIELIRNAVALNLSAQNKRENS